MVEALRELLPIFAAAYLLDCVMRVGPSEVLFSSAGGRRFRLCGPGFHLGGALPAARAYSAQRLPLLLAPQGAFVPQFPALFGAQLSSAECYRFAPYEEMEVAADEERLVLGDAGTLTLLCRQESARVAELLRKLARSSPPARGREIEGFLAARFDRELVASTAEQANAAYRPLERLGTTLFALLFVALPVAVYVPEPSPAPAAVLLAAAALNYTTLAVLAARAARRLRGHGIVAPRGAVAAICMFPPAAVHAAEGLGRHALAAFEPVAAAAQLLPREEVLRLARFELHAADHAAESGDAAWRAAWALRRHELLRLFGHAGIGIDEASAPPLRRDAAAHGYCVVCEAEFVQPLERCPECEAPLLRYT